MSAASVSATQKARILAEALPFIRAFHASTLIIRFGGGAMADPALREGFARDVALLRLVGMNPIIVHGGGWRIDELLRTMKIPIREHRGMRMIDEATMNVVEMVLGEINQDLVGLINRFGAKAVGLSGQDGRFIHARAMKLPADAGVADAPDLGLVGDVESIDPDVIHLLLSRGFIPVIMPIGVGSDGTAYQINSDIVAGRLARTLHAEKLILMTNVPGVFGRDGKLAFVLTASDADALLRDGTVKADLQPRLAAALQAVREGVRSVHIIDGGVPSALLLEVLTNSGVGTALRSDSGPHFLADSRSYLPPPSTIDSVDGDVRALNLLPQRRRVAASIEISEEHGVRYLHFGSHWVQGAMRIARPWSLELEYTRDMMAALLLRPGARWPRSVLMIGLGAASITKFLYRHRPLAALTVIEIDAAVVNAAAQYFKLPDDPRRLTIEIGDGHDYMAATDRAFDLILVDGYDGKGRVGMLDTLPFYWNCRARLTDRGMLVANFLNARRGLAESLDRINEVFSSRAFAVPPCASGNIIAIAATGAPIDLAFHTMKAQARRMNRDAGLNLLPTIARVEATQVAGCDRFML